MLHPPSSLVISWVILKLAKNQFPHTLSNYSINMFSDTLGVSVVFLNSCFKNKAPVMC